MCRMHRNLVHGFFRNASGMLRADGEIHINHKTSAPFNHWNLEELAAQKSLALIGCVDFKIADYPGYNNKRGASLRCDEPFPLGERHRDLVSQFLWSARDMLANKEEIHVTHKTAYPESGGVDGGGRAKFG
ncbi:25S rRNA (uracil2634-N3)-methyltransferase [Sarracenia purpurea var. burkii]